MIEIILLLLMTLLLGGLGLFFIIIGICIFRLSRIDDGDIILGFMFLIFGISVLFITVNMYFPMVTITI